MKFAAIQMNSQDDAKKNWAEAEKQIRLAARDGAKVIALPEYFAFFTADSDAQRSSGQEIAGGPVYQSLAELARELSVTIHAGSVMESDGDRRYNTSVVFDCNGSIVAKYRKIHLFDVEVPGGVRYLESSWVSRGSEVVVYEIDGVKIGCAICYDIRFPELFSMLRDKGCDVIVLPAAFTLQTGKDHWEVLLRARAIETQTYIVAPAQVFTNTGGTKSCWGHAMIVDPWGAVVAQASDRVGFVSAHIDFDYLQSIRRSLPVANHHVFPTSHFAKGGSQEV